MNRRSIFQRSMLLATGVCAALLSACSTPHIQDYAKETPALELSDYFNGTLDAYGIFSDRSGKVVKATLLSGEKTVRNHVIQNRKQVDGIIQPLFKDILASKQLSGQVDYRLLTSLLVCMMDGIILEYSFSGTKIDFDEIAKQWVVFLFQKSEAEVNSRSLGG